MTAFDFTTEVLTSRDQTDRGPVVSRIWSRSQSRFRDQTFALGLNARIILISTWICRLKFQSRSVLTQTIGPGRRFPLDGLASVPSRSRIFGLTVSPGSVVTFQAVADSFTNSYTIFLRNSVNSVRENRQDDEHVAEDGRRDQRRKYQRVGDRFGRGQGAGAVRRRLVHREISTTVRDRDGHGRGDVSHRRVVVSSEWP